MQLSQHTGNFLIRRNTDQASYSLFSEDKSNSGQFTVGCIQYPASWDAQPEKRFFRSRNPVPFVPSPQKTEFIAELKFIAPSKEKYIESVKRLLQHIKRGDIYEINFCVQFLAENAIIDPLTTFLSLDSISKAPFACLARFDNDYIICSSPERFVKRTDDLLITQPIKGTARRGKTNQEDEGIKNALSNSEKDKSENVMAVDVARHDLSKIATRGSVEVNELCKVYTFEQVHQMISTVSCRLKEDITFDKIIDAAFPMASMTGAPKTRAMQLIGEYENFDREFYSGSVGVIDGNGDFDFNVVIRSIFYNAEQRHVSFAVGSAITALSDPEEEWNECLLKADAMLKVLNCGAPAR